MPSWWCYLVYFIYSCTSINSEVIQVNYTPNRRVKINVGMSNMGNASSYVMLLNSKEGLHSTNISGLIETYDRKKTLEFTTFLVEGHNNSTLYVELTYKGDSCCGMKPVAKFVEKKHTRDAAKEDPCMTPNGCETEIDWKNTCTVDNARNSCIPHNQSNERASLEDNCESSKNNHTDGDPYDINVQQISWITQRNGVSDYIFDAGQVRAFRCLTDFPGYQVRWRHMKDNYTISSVDGKQDSPLTLDMTMTRFDHNTTIHCIILDYRKSEQTNFRAQSNKVRFKWKSTICGVQKPIQYNELMVTPEPKDVTYFKKGEHVEYSCHSNKIWRKSWLIIKDNAIDSSFTSLGYADNSSPVVLLLNLSESDNGASYVCQGFTYSVEKKSWTRHLSKRINFMLNGANPPRPETDVDQRQTDEMQDDDCFYCGTNLVYFGLGALIIVILIVSAWTCLREKRPSRSPHEVETYACPNTVQYVDLQTTSSSNNGRIFYRENTPYARIVGVLEPNK